MSAGEPRTDGQFGGHNPLPHPGNPHPPDPNSALNGMTLMRIADGVERIAAAEEKRNELLAKRADDVNTGSIAHAVIVGIAPVFDALIEQEKIAVQVMKNVLATEERIEKKLDGLNLVAPSSDEVARLTADLKAANDRNAELLRNAQGG